MPWWVKECGRRGATGAGRGLFLRMGCVTSSSFGVAERAAALTLPYRFDPSGLPEASWNRIPRVCAKMHAVVLIFVMAGLDPAIHVYPAATLSRRGCPARGRASRDSIDPAGLQA